MRVALLQLTSSDDPSENLKTLEPMIRDAAEGGARCIFTPEVTNCVSMNRRRQLEVLYEETDDPMLRRVREICAELRLWVNLGSLALKTRDPDGRFANRSFVIDDNGQIAARYDKIHMFDVEVTPEETYRESDGYRPGGVARTVRGPCGALGLSICYDLRFPHLYRSLAKSGAQILSVPAAFSPITGAAHWEVLLRARAIETGCFVIAAAQTGLHSSKMGKSRRTYGHSLVVAPWGEILADAGEEVGITYVDIDLLMVDKARRQVPALGHDREFDGP
ncbi:putative amidohydrolase [Shimia isoporae]|uniref:Putative amidohydrolase n=1 Tax=Shimia isoporae TaxID=647720 RepID=A0A4R1N1A3_9RHOB|nr:carbon-nitrogen hydrolase family protein [Shimia isoporae]TCK99898.1 putative amidohydrolase [Shimia isoporae]